MNKNLKILLVGIGAFVIGFGMNNYALSEMPSNYKVAVLDIQQVIENSSEVKALKQEQQLKTQELINYLEKARKDVASVSDENKKKSLEEKYSKDLLAKKNKIEKDYLTKLEKIDDAISKKVDEQAKVGNYNIVLTKGAVLYGGEDITKAVINAVK